MAITDSAYAAWLRTDAPREILAEIQCWHGGLKQTRYLARRGFQSGFFDQPKSQVYEALIQSVPLFRQAIDAPIPLGEMALFNPTGSLDSWLQDDWAGHEIRLLMGDPSWNLRDFRTILTGVISDIIAPASNPLVFSLRDKKEKLNIPAQSRLIEDEDSPSHGQPIPQCLGYNYNLEPILRDASNQVYQVHDGAIKAITQVRVDGVPVEFSANLRAGTFTLKTQPQGAIRADVQGAIIKGAYRDTGADLVRHLVTREALTAEDLDSASFTAFKSLCPQPVGLYLKDSTNLADCLDQIITQTLGGYWYFDRLGKLKLWRLDNPTGTASHEFNPDDFPRNTLTIQRRDQPIEKIELGFFRNWAPQEAGSLSESVGALARSRQSTEYARSVKTQTAPGFKDRYPLAAKPPLQGTLFSAYDGLGIRATAKADCDAEAIRRRDLFSVVRTTYSAKLTAGAFQLHLGDEIKIRHPRFGFADGQNAIVVGIEESPTGGAATVEFWR